MNKSQSETQAQPWSKMSRRWLVALSVTLGINGVTVVCAFGDRALGERASGTIRGEQGAAVAQDESQQAGNVTVATKDGANEPSPSQATSSTANETAIDSPDVFDGGPAATSVTPVASESNSNAQAVDTEATQITPINNSAGGKSASEPSLDDRIVIMNPPGTGGVVHYLIDGTTMSLMPGEFAQLESNGARRVDFHRGGDLSDTQLQMESGAYIFSVSQAGWVLLPTSSAECERLMIVCRSIQ